MLNSRYLNTAELRELGLRVGENVSIDQSSILLDVANITIGNNVRIDAGTIITPGKLTIGDYCHLGAYSHINCTNDVFIGSGCNLAQGTKIYSASDNFKNGEIGGPFFASSLPEVPRPSVVLSGVNIVGANCVLLAGTHLHTGSCLGANSLISRAIPAWEIWAGSPARRVSKRLKSDQATLKKLSAS